MLGMAVGKFATFLFARLDTHFYTQMAVLAAVSGEAEAITV